MVIGGLTFQSDNSIDSFFTFYFGLVAYFRFLFFIFEMNQMSYVYEKMLFQSCFDSFRF